MSQGHISATLRQAIIERADNRCEYCLIRATEVLLPHQPDHIIAEQHGGETTSDNLALACIHCNRHKGPNIASLDSETGQLTPLFNPRRDSWAEHFALGEAYIHPLTPIGRVTVRLLKLNTPERLRVREALIAMGRYP